MLEKNNVIIFNKLNQDIDSVDFYIDQGIYEDSFPLVDFSNFKECFKNTSISEINSILIDWGFHCLDNNRNKYGESINFKMIFAQVGDYHIPYLYFFQDTSKILKLIGIPVRSQFGLVLENFLSTKGVKFNLYYLDENQNSILVDNE